MNKTEVCLGLGCNLGDRMVAMKKALNLLEGLGEDFSASAIYESKAWGYDDDRPYLNAVCCFLTDLSAHELHRETLRIERELGRKAPKRRTGEPYQARRMDIDILLYGDHCLESDELVIPHPRLHLRRFVLEPLGSLKPGWVHPILHKTVRTLLKEVADHSELSIYRS